MKVDGVTLDADAENFLDEIAEELVTLGAAPEEAAERVHKAMIAPRPGLLPGPQPIGGDHIIYHQTPEYWAKAIWFGRRDSWRYPAGTLKPTPRP